MERKKQWFLARTKKEKGAVLTIDNFHPRPIFNTMCNRVVQNDVIVKPRGKVTVLMKGPGGEFELPFPAKTR